MKKIKKVMCFVSVFVLCLSIHGYGAEKFSGYYKIIAKHSSKCLDVTGGSTKDTANVIQYSCHNGDNQLWEIIPSGNGYYKIIAKHSSKCLDVTGGSTKDTANVIQYSCHNGDNQLWEIMSISAKEGEVSPDVIRVITNIIVKKGGKCPYGYHGVVDGAKASERDQSFTDVNKGIGGDTVGICAKMEELPVSSSRNVLTGIMVSHWPHWKVECPQGFTPATGNEGGKLTTRTKGRCWRQGLCVRWTPLNEIKNHKEFEYQYISDLSLKYSDKPLDLVSNWQKAGLDIHKGCGGQFVYLLAHYSCLAPEYPEYCYKIIINPLNLERYVKQLITPQIRIDKTGEQDTGNYWENCAIAHYKTNLGACDLHAWVHSSQSLCLEHHGDCQYQDCKKEGLICQGSRSCDTGGGILLTGFDKLKITKLETYLDKISLAARIPQLDGTVNLEASTSSMNSCGLIQCKCWMAPGLCCIHPHACTRIYLRDVSLDMDILNINSTCALNINVDFKLSIDTSGLGIFGPLLDYVVNQLAPILKSKLVDQIKNQIDSKAKKYLCTLIGSEISHINMTQPSSVSPPGQLTNFREMPFNVLSYNVMAFPYFIEFSGQNERLNAILQKFVDLDKKYTLDVIGIDELWTGYNVMANASPFYNEFVNKMKSNWPYVSDPTSGEAPLNSGLRIFSKWPILKSKSIYYSSCKDEDCLASKGALFVKVKKTMTNVSKIFNLIITHPQAGNVAEIQQIRKTQFQTLKQFVASLLADNSISTSEPLIFLGDMNMNQFDKENFPGEYEYLLSTLEAELPKITDEKGIDWQNSSYYKDNCPEPWANPKYQYPWTICNHLKADLTPPDKNEWLDYILYGVKFQKPVKSRVFTVMDMKQLLSVPWLPSKAAQSLVDANKNMKSISDLSDHHPLLAEMIFEID